MNFKIEWFNQKLFHPCSIKPFCLTLDAANCKNLTVKFYRKLY